MTFSKAASQSGKYVCCQCIGDTIVSAEIEAGGKHRKCSYCNTVKKTVSLEQLADRLDGVYREFVELADEEPHWEGDSDSPCYQRDGDTPTAIICEMLECDDEQTAEDIADHLSSQNAWAVAKDGEEDFFDTSSDVYEINIPRDPEFKETWTNFCHAIKHSRRFFNDEAAALLHRILGPITNPSTTTRKSAIRTITPGDPDAGIFRGRVANDAKTRDAILAAPIGQLGASPRELNNAGRMNCAGIPVFYGSFDVETCVAELRCPVGGAALIGKFETTRPIRVLDLTLLKDVQFGVSYFDPAVVQKVAYNRFLRGFHKEIRKPVLPGSEHLEYLPTQFVAEYLCFW